MTGRVATAWFLVPWLVAETLLSPDLLPEPSAYVRARLRFYDLAYVAPDATEDRLTPTGGRFRECVVAFAGRAHDVAGEVSLWLWTDSDTYLMWGREVFGWPIRLATVELSGSLWTGQELEGATGTCRMQDAWGTASLMDVSVSGSTTTGTPTGAWLTPRRVLHAAGRGGETRELLVVRPAVKQPGRRYSARGRTVFDFASSHPLHSLGEVSADIEIADGFELLIGVDVEVLSADTIHSTP
jgi:hypothetical protein